MLRGYVTAQGDEIGKMTCKGVNRKSTTHLNKPSFLKIPQFSLSASWVTEVKNQMHFPTVGTEAGLNSAVTADDAQPSCRMDTPGVVNLVPAPG